MLHLFPIIAQLYQHSSVQKWNWKLLQLAKDHLKLYYTELDSHYITPKCQIFPFRAHSNIQRKNKPQNFIVTSKSFWNVFFILFVFMLLHFLLNSLVESNGRCRNIFSHQARKMMKSIKPVAQWSLNFKLGWGKWRFFSQRHTCLIWQDLRGKNMKLNTTYRNKKELSRLGSDKNHRTTPRR